MRSEKYGYSLWKAIDAPLWKIDIRSAEILAAAILTGDEQLFKDYCQEDVYRRAADVLDIDDRKLIKRLWLAIQYGKAKCNVEDELKDIDHKLRKYLKQLYPAYSMELDRFRGLGKTIQNKNVILRLPHNVPALLEPGRGFALPALAMQSSVVCLITELFLKFHELGYQPVFDYHDAVLCCRSISKKKANDLFRPIIKEFVRRHELSWDIGNIDFVTVEKLSFSKMRVFSNTLNEKSAKMNIVD